MSSPTAYATSSRVGTTSQGLLNLWLSFHIIGGHIFLPILVGIFIFLSKRHPTLINLCVVWIFVGFISCLLLYTNTQNGPEPPFDLCLIQASTLYGTLPLTTSVCLTVVYHIWTTLQVSKIDPVVAGPWNKLRLAVLIASPWITFGIWATAGAWIGIHDPVRISRSRRFFYCSLDYDPFSKAISVFCSICLFIAIGLAAHMGTIVVRNWRAVRKGLSTGEVDVSLVIRVLCFLVYVFIGLIMSLVSIYAPKSPIPDLYLASVGVVVALIFGSQKNVFVALMFWKNRGINSNGVERTRFKEKRIDLDA